MVRALCFFLLMAGYVHAVPPAEHPAKVTLVSENRSLTPGQTQSVGVLFKLQPGWHVYWKNPGDSGTAPEVTWKTPEKVSVGEWAWPTPERFEIPPLVNFGYEKEVLFIADLQTPADAKAVTLRADAKWLVCRETCIPGKATLSLTLKKGAAVASPEAARFERTRATLPQLRSDFKATASASPGSLRIGFSVPKKPAGAVHFFPEPVDLIENAAPQKVRWLSDTEGELVLPWEAQRTTAPTEYRGLLVAEGGWPGGPSAGWIVTGAVATDSSTPAIASTIEGTTSMTSLWQMLFFAFLGGMILNLMPCVFPILSIKILSFVQQAGHSKKILRRHGWAFAAGVLVSDLALAGLLIALRAGGKTLGWGFQLQSPFFVLGLAFLMFLLALSLLGLFEVGDRLAGLGSKLTAKEGVRGSFFSGVLAMIVATPCTAPFMGSAVGFALTQPAWISLLIFTALGAGMALPYLALSYSPKLLNHLPRPGAWMERFKQLMAFPLFATVIWLLWVFGQQVSMDGVARVLFALLALAMAVWAFSTKAKARGSSVLATLFALGALLASGYLAYTAAKMKAVPSTTSSASEGIDWVPYSEEKLKEFTSKGTPVFLDFTAAWCVSCQVNEKVVFSSQEVRDRFKELGIVTMKADWTNGEEHITKKLAEFGRSGVPFYLLYGKTPNAPPGTLPEILSPGIVLDAISKL